jgi:hypothetical protein
MAHAMQADTNIGRHIHMVVSFCVETHTCSTDSEVIGARTDYRTIWAMGTVERSGGLTA